jgi:hypothetical protein
MSSIEYRVLNRRARHNGSVNKWYGGVGKRAGGGEPSSLYNINFVANGETHSIMISDSEVSALRLNKIFSSINVG